MAYPTVETLPVTNIGTTSAYFTGYLISDGGKPVTSTNTYLGTYSPPPWWWNFGAKPAPTIYGGWMTGLSPNTTYYVKASAANADGYGVGAILSFTTLPIGAPQIGAISINNPIVSRDCPDSDFNCTVNITDDGGSAVTSRGIGCEMVVVHGLIIIMVLVLVL